MEFLNNPFSKQLRALNRPQHLSQGDPVNHPCLLGVLSISMLHTPMAFLNYPGSYIALGFSRPPPTQSSCAGFQRAAGSCCKGEESETPYAAVEQADYFVCPRLQLKFHLKSLLCWRMNRIENFNTVWRPVTLKKEKAANTMMVTVMGLFSQIMNLGPGYLAGLATDSFRLSGKRQGLYRRMQYES